jgi:acyl carrier protein
MLRLFGKRLMSTSLMHGSAYPHNELPRPEHVNMYDKEGNIVQHNWLVLKSEQEIEKYVINLFKNYFRTTNKYNITLESTFRDHGLDSLDAVELVVRVEDELGYVIPGEALRCFSTVRSFVNYIKQTEDFKKEFNKHPIN